MRLPKLEHLGRLFDRCFKKHFGVEIVAAALDDGLWTYLQEAAKWLVKFAIGTNAVAWAGTIIYYSGVSLLCSIPFNIGLD